MSRKGQIAGHEGDARLIGRVGDDKGPGVLPLVQPFGDLVRADEPSIGTPTTGSVMSANDRPMR